MKERPILFNAEMVRAILDGRKTQTRRLLKPQPAGGLNFAGWCIASSEPKDEGKANFARGEHPFLTDTQRFRCPLGKPGDVLWVRETWQPKSAYWWDMLSSGKDRTNVAVNNAVTFAATCPAPEHQGRWKPSIHMPRWASRIDLLIKDVRIERLQDISEEDARAEGSYLRRCDCSTMQSKPKTPIEALFIQHWCMYHGTEFKKLWNDLYKNWDANPWVWVIDFEKIKG